jgi:hypothetical protein
MRYVPYQPLLGIYKCFDSLSHTVEIPAQVGYLVSSPPGSRTAPGRKISGGKLTGRLAETPYRGRQMPGKPIADNTADHK